MEFHKKRQPFYIGDNGDLVFPRRKMDNDVSHAEWFSEEGIPFTGTMRGYLMENYMMFYINDFEIPSISPHFLAYMFIRYPDIMYIGLGCEKGEIGEHWTPKLVVFRGQQIILKHYDGDKGTTDGEGGSSGSSEPTQEVSTQGASEEVNS